MGRLSLTVACGAYDRTAPLADGRVRAEGTDLNVVFLQPEECFWRMAKHAEFDVAEMSLATHAMLCARGDERFVGIPAFLSRSFRHSSVYVRADSPVREARELAGCRIGVPEYQMTAAVWTRALLAHDHGLDLRSVTWRTGGLEQPGRRERQPLALPDWVRVEPLPADRTLTTALLDGELDALMAPRVPAAFRQPDPPLRRLFGDYAERELAYYRDTGLFPIMHLVVVRRDLADGHPWLPQSLLKAFTAAKDTAVRGAADAPALPVTMPFLLAALEQQQEVFGDDPWPYGVDANAAALTAFLDYMAEQGLLKEPLEPAALFAPSTLDQSRI